MPAFPYVRAVSGTNGQITEDTPADYLEGDMELQVVLPNGKNVKSYFDRRTQMMDLLVQIGTKHQLATGDHFLQITDDVTGNPIPFLPSSVLGALDVRTVYVVPKSRINGTKFGKKLNLPFEQTFRLKVYLPKSQLFVTRVSANTQLSTVLSIVCKEKELNPKAYELRHPVNRLEPLNLSATLEDYNLCEVSLVTAGRQDISPDNWEEMPRKTSLNGSPVAVQPPPPSKQKRGLFSFVFGKKTSKTSVVSSSSLSGGSVGDRSATPVRSNSPDVSNSVSPTTPPLATSSVVSAPSYSERMSSAKSMETMSMISDTSSTRGTGGVARFKKRQAPVPPPVNRMSSPLSKEHLSKLPETSKLQSAFSKSTSNLAYENRAGNRLSLSNLATASSTSTSSILSALRKSKKAPPPPSNIVPSSDTSDECVIEEAKPVPTAKTEEASTNCTPEIEIKVEESRVIVDKPSPVDTIDKKDKEESLSEEVAAERVETEVQEESLNTTISTISSDSLDVNQKGKSPEAISHNEKEELSYDDVANTTDRRGDKETDSDAYEDIELKTEENAEELSTPLKEQNDKLEPVYAQVNKKKKNSKQEEYLNETTELTEICVSPLSDAPSDSNSSFNDSAIEISPQIIISRSSSPLDTWEYKIPTPPTPFKDLSSDEEVSDIVSDLLNTASFQEALLNESEGETKKGDEIIDVISETGPETLTITEPVKPDVSEIVLQHEYIGESTTDVKKHVAINNLYETLDTQALKELTFKEASQVSEILVELSETLKKRESDSEVKEAPPVPDIVPPAESSESSRRSSVSEFSDKMRFSISTYKSRVEEEGLCYEKKLLRIDSKKTKGLENDLSRRSSICSESSQSSEIRDQNENVIKTSDELHDPIIIPPCVIPDELSVNEEQIVSENHVESIVLPPMDFVSEITSDSVIEKVELKNEQLILDLAKLEPVAPDQSPLSNSTLSSRRNSVTPNVEPSSDLSSPLSLLLPAPSLFADDEDPEAIRLQEEYIQFQQRILAYQQKRLNQGSKNCVKQSEPCEAPESVNPENDLCKTGDFSAVDEKSESMDKKEEVFPKFQDENQVEAVNSTTTTSSSTTLKFQQAERDITKNGVADLPRLRLAHKTVENGNHTFDDLRHEENEPVILTLNEDHIKAFSEIIEEKQRPLPTQEDEVLVIPAPLTFSSKQPVMLDGICQTESDDYHSLVGIETTSRPESQTSTRSGSDHPDDETFRYRYQGPPKVVMEPWRSRPSVHVSISTNPVNAYNLDDIESKINARKMEETAEVKELPKIESVKLQSVKKNAENKEEKNQVESRKLSFESSRSAFESITNRKPNLVRRTSIDTPRPFELKSLSQVRRPMFNPVQVGNKVVQPKMPFRVPEVRGFPLRAHSEVEEKSLVEKSRHDLIALARRPSAEKDVISSEDRQHLSKLRDETDSSRKIDVVVRRKVSIIERPKSADELDAAAPNAKEASLKVGSLKHSTSADFQTSFWNELNGIKLRPVAGKQTEACAQSASVPAPPPPAPNSSISSQSLPLLKKTNSSKIQLPTDTRGDLLNSIRSFGENNGLKKTGIRLT